MPPSHINEGKGKAGMIERTAFDRFREANWQQQAETLRFMGQVFAPPQPMVEELSGKLIVETHADAHATTRNKFVNGDEVTRPRVIRVEGKRDEPTTATAGAPLMPAIRPLNMTLARFEHEESANILNPSIAEALAPFMPPTQPQQPQPKKD